jgi:hypothetical protein
MSLLHNVSDGTHGETENPPPTDRRRRRIEPPAPPAQSNSHTGGSLTRVTANFTPRAMGSLERVSEKTGDSRTDVLNRAVMAYETMIDLLEEGDGRTLRVQLPNGEVRVLQFIG